MGTDQSEYAKTGVDVRKKGIEIFEPTIDNLFPEAFCVVQQDPDFPDLGIVTHTDSAGSKPVQSYLHFKETGDISVFEGLAQDVVGMNLGDTDCVRAKPMSFVDHVEINGFYVPKTDFLQALNRGFDRVFNTLERYGIKVPFGGGETADSPDQQRTVSVSGTLVGRVKLSDVITGDRIGSGDVIVGLRSGGQAKYEDKPNSGIMCNGITLARHCLMSPDYEEMYPEIREPRGARYSGRFRTDEHHPELGMTVGEAIISPTRLYGPVIAHVLKELGQDVHGLVQNSGGGQTKCLRVGKNVRYVKDGLPEPDPIFYLIQQESGEEWQAMYEGFNMGIGFDLIVPESYEAKIVKIAGEYGIGAQRTGDVKAGEGKPWLQITSQFGDFIYP